MQNICMMSLFSLSVWPPWNKLHLMYLTERYNKEITNISDINQPTIQPKWFSSYAIQFRAEKWPF